MSIHTIDLLDGVFIRYEIEDVFGEVKVKSAMIDLTCENTLQLGQAYALLNEVYDDNESLKIAALEDYNKFHAQ